VVETSSPFRRQPHDDVAERLAGAALATEPVDHGALQRRPLVISGSKATLPTGNVALIASNASSVTKMRPGGDPHGLCHNL
jgi:hypothetical protein